MFIRTGRRGTGTEMVEPMVPHSRTVDKIGKDTLGVIPVPGQTTQPRVPAPAR